MKKSFTLLLMLVGLISLGGFFLLQDVTNSIVLALALFGAMAAWFFLTSLRAFKKKLKVAYIILAIGIMAFGLSQVVLLFYIIETLPPELLSVILVGFYLLGMFTMYISIWKFARLLDIRGPWRSLLFVSVLAVAIAVVVNIIPLAPQQPKSLLFYLTFGGFIAGGAYGLAAAVLSGKIRAKLAPYYRSAMNWLVAGLWLAAFTSFHETTIRLVPFFSEPRFYPYFDYGINLWPFLLASVLFLGASLAFRQLSRQFGALPENASFLDTINYVSQQVSTPKAIDVILDQVREITAAQTPGTELSSTDKTKLLGVYKQLEEYLVTKEPLRKVPRDELRVQLPDNFRQALILYEKGAGTS